MKNILTNGLRSVRGFLWFAAALAVAYWIADALGWRQDTAFLSGTPAASPLHGLLYIGLYFGWTIVCPILLLAAGIDLLLRCASRHNQAKAGIIEE